MRRIYPALMWKDEGMYIIEAPDIDGCLTSGRTVEEAVENMKDALAGCICVLEDENVPVAEPSDPTTVMREGTTTALIEIDTLKYREETDTRSVRKNVSMPAWMANMADKRGLNCSQILQEALMRRLDMA